MEQSFSEFRHHDGQQEYAKYVVIALKHRTRMNVIVSRDILAANGHA